MNLSEFIRSEKEQILSECDELARALIPEAEGCDFAQLKDDADRILAALGHDLDIPASRFAAEAPDLTVFQRIAQIQSLRASVLRQYAEAQPIGDVEDLTRFNEALDQILAEATRPLGEDTEIPLITRNVSLGGGTPQPEPRLAEEESFEPPTR